MELSREHLEHLLGKEYQSRVTSVHRNRLNLRVEGDGYEINGFLYKKDCDHSLIKKWSQISRGDPLKVILSNIGGKDNNIPYFSRKSLRISKEELLGEIKYLEKKTRSLTKSQTQLSTELEDQKDLLLIATIKSARFQDQIDDRKNQVAKLEQSREDLNAQCSKVEDEIRELQRQLKHEIDTFQDQVSQKKQEIEAEIKREEVELSQSLIQIKKDIQFYTALPEVEVSPRPKDGAALVNAITSALYYHEGIKLHFHPQLVRELLASLSSAQLTILSGPSGTGKSAICRSLDTLKLASVLVCPVQSNWTSSAQLLGYHNPLTTDSKKSWVHTPFYSFLKNADTQQAKKSLSIAVLDEMNLAFVEHYLAELLSRLSEPERPVELPLPGDPDDRTLKINSDFRLVGTVNMDETTHQLSPKVIDRSCVLRFNNPLLLKEDLPIPQRDDQYWLTQHQNGIPQVGQWLTQRESIHIQHNQSVSKLLTLLNELNRNILQKLGPDVPYSFRTLTQIEMLASCLLWLGASFEEMLDSVIRLKILPRLRFFNRGEKIREDMNQFAQWLREQKANEASQTVDAINQSARDQGGAYNFWLY